MKRIIPLSIFAAFTLTACIVTPGPYGSVTVSPLPAIVELDADPYYYQSGYYYNYQNNYWRYSKSRSGPWTDLPKSHWPKEVRHKNRGDGRDGDHDRDRDYRPEYDRR
jgi:hypothetical protein